MLSLVNQKDFQNARILTLNENDINFSFVKIISPSQIVVFLGCPRNYTLNYLLIVSKDILGLYDVKSDDSQLTLKYDSQIFQG